MGMECHQLINLELANKILRKHSHLKGNILRNNDTFPMRLQHPFKEVLYEYEV